MEAWGRCSGIMKQRSDSGGGLAAKSDSDRHQIESTSSDDASPF